MSRDEFTSSENGVLCLDRREDGLIFYKESTRKIEQPRLTVKQSSKCDSRKISVVLQLTHFITFSGNTCKWQLKFAKNCNANCSHSQTHTETVVWCSVFPIFFLNLIFNLLFFFKQICSQLLLVATSLPSEKQTMESNLRTIPVPIKTMFFYWNKKSKGMYISHSRLPLLFCTKDN